METETNETKISHEGFPRKKNKKKTNRKHVEYDQRQKQKEQ